MLKPTNDFSRGCVLLYKRGEKNQIALHHLRVGSRMNVFGLQMANKGMLIYSVLWCITAQSDISNGVPCSGKLLVLAIRTTSEAGDLVSVI